MMQEFYKPNKGKIHIFILLLFGISGLWLFTPHVSASIELAQGDVAYKNETVDISMVVSWPDFDLAYCEHGYYGCQPPDQIIHIEGNLHKYWLDPKVWKYGTYYRWDGEWHKGENSVAFTINPGTRPVEIKDSNNVSLVNTTIKTGASASRRTSDDLRKFIIAKGDDFNLITHYPSQYNDSGSMWFFGWSDTELDIKLMRNDTDYSHQFAASDTGKMEVGDYTGFLQFSGRNGFQDVFYNKDKDELDTPYDDDIIPDVSLETTAPEQILGKYRYLSTPSEYNDDIRVPINVTISEPSLLVTEVLQGENKFWVHGTTTWSEGTVVVIKLDPDNYALRKDIDDHTWETVATGNLSELREFDITIPYDMSELSLSEHEITASISKNYIENNAKYLFRVSDIYVIPTPTPAIKKIMSTVDYEPLPTMIQPVVTDDVTVEPTAPQSPAEPVVISTGSYVVVETGLPIEEVGKAPTKAITVSTTRIIPTATKDQNIHVPLPWWVAIAAIGIAVWRRK